MLCFYCCTQTTMLLLNVSTSTVTRQNCDSHFRLILVPHQSDMYLHVSPKIQTTQVILRRKGDTFNGSFFVDPVSILPPDPQEAEWLSTNRRVSSSVPSFSCVHMSTCSFVRHITPSCPHWVRHGTSTVISVWEGMGEGWRLILVNFRRKQIRQTRN